jgi:hypothetical protein
LFYFLEILVFFSLVICNFYLESLGALFGNYFIVWRIQFEILPKGYYWQRKQDSSTKDVTVKKEGSLKLIRLQDSVFFKMCRVAGCNWKYLISGMNCKLAVSFGVNYIDFFFFFFFILDQLFYSEKYFFCSAADP